MIRAVYIIDEGGICIYCRLYDERFGDPQLISGLITALCQFSKEAIGGNLQFMRSGEQYVIIKEFDIINTMIIADEFDEVDSELMESISFQLIRKYAAELKNGNDILNLNEFDSVMDQLIPIEKTALHSIQPTEPLDALSVIDLPEELKDVALLIIRERSLTPDEAALHFENNVRQIKEKLDRLVYLGFVGVRFDSSEPTYFV